MAAAAACTQARAQDAQGAATAAPRETISIDRFVSLTGTYTDNGNLATNGRQSEFLTEATAGLRVIANTARLRGYLDYRLSGIVHSGDSEANEIQNALNAFGTAELLERRAFIDVAAGISQQLVSAFGTRTADTALGNANQQEVATFRVSPYLRGPLGTFADYEARLAYTATRSDENTVSDNTSKLASLRVAGDESLYPLNWSVDASRHEIDYTQGHNTQEDRLDGLLGWAVSRELEVAVLAGKESNNYISAQKQSYDSYGAQVTWTPSERTKAMARVQRRFFGTAHTVNVAHHTARTSWLLSSSRDVVTSPAQLVIGALGRAYDLFFQQFAAIEPDPVLRQQKVLLYLAVYGIDPQRIVMAPFLVSAATLENQQVASFAWRWVRDTVVITAARSRSSRLDTIVSVLDDFTQSSSIRQNALTLNYAHRLTPASSAGLDLSWQKVMGDLQATTLKSAALTWSASITQRSSVAAAVRHSRFSSTARPYNETAVSATYSMQF